MITSPVKEAMLPTSFMGMPIKSEEDLVDLIQRHLNVSGTDATDAMRKAIDALTNRPQSRMTKTVLSDISMLLRKWRLPIGREHFLKLQKSMESQDLDQEPLTEIDMSPGALSAFASQAASLGVRAGFEAELLFSGISSGSSDEYEADYERDEGVDSTTTLDDIKDFFSETMSSNSRAWERIEQDYLEAVGEKAEDYVRGNFDEEAQERALAGQKHSDLIYDYLENVVELDADRIERVITAGNAAPSFWSSADERKYRQDNEDYAIYADARDNVEASLEEEIDRIRDEVEEELRDDFYSNNEYYLGEWLNDRGITSMFGVFEEFELDWPHWTAQSTEAFDLEDIQQAAGKLEKMLGRSVRVSGDYHGTQRDAASYIIEPDSSLRPDDDGDAAAEIISPPLPLDEAIQDLNKVLDWADDHQAYTNRSTGLHVGVSLPDMQQVDYVKLALLMGDEYVLKQFNRAANSYTESVFKKIAGTENPQIIAQAMDSLKKGLVDQASTALKYTVFSDRGTTGKYVSINWRGDYVEFRSMGNTYLTDRERIINTIYRYVRALVSAATPDMDRREYLTKLYKVVQNASKGIAGPQAEPVNMVISKFLAGDIGREEVVKYKDYLRQMAQTRKDPGAAKPTPPELEPMKKWRVILGSNTFVVRAKSASEAVEKVLAAAPALEPRRAEFDVEELSGPNS